MVFILPVVTRFSRSKVFIFNDIQMFLLYVQYKKNGLEIINILYTTEITSRVSISLFSRARPTRSAMKTARCRTSLLAIHCIYQSNDSLFSAPLIPAHITAL